MYNNKLFYIGLYCIFFFYIYYKYNMYLIKKKIVFYTCFFGGNNNIANIIQAPPSQIYDCYYFSNNLDTLNSLKNTNWIPIFVNIPIKDSDTDNAMDSKELKACPQHFDVLNNYKYNCYFDSKIIVDENKVINMIDTILSNTDYLYIIPKHQFVKPNVWNEYNEALKQKRYEIEKDKYKNYILNQLHNGLLAEDNVHYTTHFIIRKKSKKTHEINELWFKHIKECGIECQISFFFIQQIYKKYIYPIETYDGYSY